MGGILHWAEQLQSATADTGFSEVFRFLPLRRWVSLRTDGWAAENHCRVHRLSGKAGVPDLISMSIWGHQTGDEFPTLQSSRPQGSSESVDLHVVIELKSMCSLL